MDLRQELMGWLKAYAPAIWLVSKEEERAISWVKDAAARARGDKEPLIWSQTRGLSANFRGIDPTTQRLTTALDTILEERADGRVCILLDPDFTHPLAARALKDLITLNQGRARSVVVISGGFEIHKSLNDLFVKLEMPPPARDQMEGVLKQVFQHANRSLPTPNEVEALIDAGQGLMLSAWRRCLTKIMIGGRPLSADDIRMIQREKCRLVLSAPHLQVECAQIPLSRVGGMETYTEWIRSHDKAFLRGLLLVGMPGCGQAMAVRATATHWGMPLVELDGMLFKRHRTSEPQRMAALLKRVESSAPCLLWLPRLDAAFDAEGELGGEARTSGALVLERWLLDPKRKTIVIATAQNPENLPLRLTIRGAFDKNFFVDLPNSDERRAILRMLLELRGLNVEELNLEMLVAASDGFNGSQIAQAIDRGVLEAKNDVANLTMVDLLHSLRQTTPMAAHLGATRRKLKAWAQRWAVMASAPREG